MADWDLRCGLEIAEALSGYIGVPARRLELAQDIAAALRDAERRGLERALKAAAVGYCAWCNDHCCESCGHAPHDAASAIQALIDALAVPKASEE